jgi:hypothetical protein
MVDGPSLLSGKNIKQPIAFWIQLLAGLFSALYVKHAPCLSGEQFKLAFIVYYWHCYFCLFGIVQKSFQVSIVH